MELAFTVQPLQPLLDDARRPVNWPVDAPLPDHIDASERPTLLIIEIASVIASDSSASASQLLRLFLINISWKSPKLSSSTLIAMGSAIASLTTPTAVDAEQGYGVNGELSAFPRFLVPSFDRRIPGIPSRDSADVNLTSVDRSFHSADATGQWTL